MNGRQKGFTLLELCICLVLFSVFLEGIWGFYSKMYFNDVQASWQMTLMNEGNDVEHFIRQCMREAIQIKITVQGGSIEPISSEYSSLDQDIIDRPLQKIEFTRMIDMGKGDYQEKKCRIEMVRLNNETSDKGKYKLTYEMPGKPGSNTISECIESITISRYQHSNQIEFKCIFQKMDEQDERLSYSKCFSESIGYKLSYE